MNQISRDELLNFKEVAEFIEKNNYNIEIVSQMVEDVELFLEIIFRIKKMRNMKQPNNRTKKNKKENENPHVHSYTKTEIKNIIYNNGCKVTEMDFTKQDLTDMYMEIYKSKPLTKYTKQDIYNSIVDYFNREKRAEELDI